MGLARANRRPQADRAAPATWVQQAAAGGGGLVTAVIRMLAADPSLWPGDVRWSPPRRSDAPGPGEQPGDRTWPDGPRTGTAPAIPVTSGDCTCTLIAALSTLPVALALTSAKTDERQTPLGIFDAGPGG